jgi:hypothetical protein
VNKISPRLTPCKIGPYIGGHSYFSPALEPRFTFRGCDGMYSKGSAGKWGSPDDSGCSRHRVRFA